MMKRKLHYLILFTCLYAPRSVVAQVADSSAQWTWIKGSSTINTPGVYGVQGAGAPGNTPGARTNSMCWTDTAGNFWLFGGDGLDGYGNSGRMNDLWLYDRAASQWIWKKGSDTSAKNGTYGTWRVAAPENRPGGRSHAITWTDKSGKLWLFGGTGFGATGSTAANLNDLWKYDPVTNEWTWMSGATTTAQLGKYGTQGMPADTTTPGARNSPAGWTDTAGNLWLFGGNGVAVTVTAGNMNDLWTYNVTTNQWTWVKGLNGINQFANYAGGVPGARQGAVAWPDDAGNVYLFGGTGLVQSGSANRIGDLWKYDPAGNTWTFIKGATTTLAAGVYGTRGVPDGANRPGARAVASAWKDVNGKLWLMGGLGVGASGSDGRLCDLWMFDPVTTNWTWMRGLQTTGQAGIYGTQGTPAPDNRPGGRGALAAWKDTDGNFWAFGGIGMGSTTTDGRSNDLWRLAPPPSCLLPTPVITASRPLSFCQGDSVVLRGTTSGSGISYRWLEGTTILAGKTADTLAVYAPGNYRVEISNSTCADTSSATAVTVYSLPAAVITASGPVSFCQGDSVTLTAAPSGAGFSYRWLRDGVTTVNITDHYLAETPGIYRVAVTNSNNCTDTSAGTTVTVQPLPVINLTLSGPASFCQGDSVVLNAGTGAGWNYVWKRNQAAAGGNTPGYTATASGNYQVRVTDGNNCSDSASAAVQVHPRPVVTVTPPDTAFCQGGSVMLHVVTADTGLSYQWKDDNGAINNATAAFLQVTQTGSYYVVAGTLHAVNCMDSSGIAVVTVHPLPLPVITWDGNELSTGSWYDSYQWHVDGQAIAGATAAAWTPSVRGAYEVEVTDTNGCTAISAPQQVNNPGGIHAWTGGGDVRVYPNPVQGILYIDVPAPALVTVRSMDGRVIRQQEVTRQMDMATLPEGMYMLDITGAHGSFVHKERIVKINR